MTTTLVLGATGLVGSAVVHQLMQTKGVKKIITLTRRRLPHEQLYPKNNSLENHIVDFSRLDSYASLFHVDIVFLCLGTTRKQAGSIAAQRIVDFDYQLKAAQLAEAQGVNHLLLVSSSGANALSNSPYLQMKGELEQALETLSIPYISIFQPSLLLGERSETRLGEKLGGWFLPLLCLLPGLKRYRPIQGEEVARKMIHISQEQQAEGIQRYTLDEIFIQP